MALKRLPSDMTFDAVRNQPSPFAKATPKDTDTGGEDAATKKNKKDVAPDPTEPPTETPTPDSNAGRVAETRQKPNDVGQPPNEPFVEPEPKPVEVQSKSSKPDPKPEGDGVLPRRARKPTNGETAIVKGRIAPLADGVTPIYDSVKARYGEKAALKHLISLALESYAVALLSGDESALEEQPGFASHPPSRVTYPSRVVSQKFYNAAQAHIDPLGIMAPTGFGTMVIQTALSWYVARNPVKD